MAFLRRVHRVERSGNVITLQTTQAYVEEAVRDGEFATTMPTDGDDVPISEDPARWGPWTTSVSRPEPNKDGSRRRSSSMDLTISTKIKPDTNKKHPVNLSGSVDVLIKKGELVFGPRLDIGGDLRISSGELPCHCRGKYGLDIDSYELRATVTAAGQGKKYNLVPESKTFLIQQRPFSTFIGPMPLVGIITKSLKLQITPSVSATVTLGGFFRAGFRDLTAGVTWSRDAGWSTVTGVQTYFEADYPKFQGVRGTLGVKAAVVAEYSIQFYGFAGPYVNFSPYLNATATANLGFAGDGSGTPTGLDWEAKAAYGVDLGVGVKLTVLGRKDLLSFGATIPLIKPITLIRGFSDGPLRVIAAVSGENQPDSLAIRLRPAFEDKWELGIGDVALIATEGGPPWGRDLATSSQDARVVPNDSVTLADVRSGKSFKHTVSLRGLPGNCAAADSSADTVAVRSAEFNALIGEGPSRAMLYIDCIPMGALRVRSVTTGQDPTARSQMILTRRDTAGSGKGTPPLTLTIPGGLAAPDTVVDQLAPANPAIGTEGRYDVGLDPGRRNCAVAKPSTKQTVITSGDTAFTEFRLTCVALGSILIRTETSDPDAAPPSDALTYQPRVLARDGVDQITTAPAPIAATGHAVVSGLVPLYNASGASGRHTVTLLSTTNRCHESAGFQRAVTVFPGDTAIAPFALQCVERLHVATRSTGAASDRDGYIVIVENADGSADSVAIAVNDTLGIAGVTPGSHSIRLADVDSNCNAPAPVNRQVSGRDSTLVSFIVHCPGPSAPTGLRATQILSHQVDLAWDSPPPGRSVSHYRLYRTTGVPAVTGVVDSITTVSHIDAGLTPYTRYLYQVAAVDVDGVVGPRSAVLSVRTLDATPPTAPTNLAAAAVSASRINLTWSAALDPESGISRYRIYRNGILLDSTSATAYGNTGLTGSATYSYYVIAVNGQGLAGPTSNSASATTLDGSPPTAPSGLTATAVSTTQIDLAWGAATDPESGIASYRVYRGGTLVGSTTTTGFTDAGLTPATTYTYEVSAVNGAGLEGARAGPASATTKAAPAAGQLTVHVCFVRQRHSCQRISGPGVRERRPSHTASGP